MENAYPVPKQIRLIDSRVYYEAQKFYCEACGARAYGGPHHIVTRASGGPDHFYNLIQLCHNCHYGALPSGQVSQVELFNIVADREGVSAEKIIETVRGLQRGGLPEL